MLRFGKTSFLLNSLCLYGACFKIDYLLMRFFGVVGYALLPLARLVILLAVAKVWIICFVHCKFASSLWHYPFDRVHLVLPMVGSVVDLLHFMINVNFNPQLLHVLILGYYYMFYLIWKTQNKVRFDNVHPSVYQIQANYKVHLVHFAKLSPRYVFYGGDREIMASLDLPFSVGWAPKVLILNWKPPEMSL